MKLREAKQEEIFNILASRPPLAEGQLAPSAEEFKAVRAEH